MQQEKQKTLRVLVVDNHTYFRESLVDFLSEIPWVEVVGEAEDGLEAFEKTISLSPDVVVMDIKMPRKNGIEASERIKGKVPSIKIILYSMFDLDVGSIEGMVAADHFLPKQRLFMDLIQTIRDVCRVNGE